MTIDWAWGFTSPGIATVEKESHANFEVVGILHNSSATWDKTSRARQVLRRQTRDASVTVIHILTAGADGQRQQSCKSHGGPAPGRPHCTRLPANFQFSLVFVTSTQSDETDLDLVEKYLSEITVGP